MIVTVKTLQQKLFKIEISESETCWALKEKIEEQQGPEFPAAALKLIYAGKILNDSSPLSEYNISPSSFVVVMVTKSAAKPAAAPSKAPETAAASTTHPPAASTQHQPTVAVTQPATAPTPAAPSVGVSSTDGGSSESSNLDWRQASSILVTGADYERVVSNLMAMGFDRESVVRALEASYNNPDRAVEYLTSGLPDNYGDVEEAEEVAPPPRAPVHQPAQQPARGPVVPPQQPVPQPVVPQAGQGEGNPLEFLRQLPQFNMLRQVVQQNPSMLQALLQQIGQSNPRLLQIISQNQEAFVNLLNEPVQAQPAAGGRRPGVAGVPPGVVPGAPAGGPGVGEAGGEGGAAGFGPGMAPGTMAIQVSPEEKEAIERLKALGFREHLVIQAYFACDKNEELAANFLLQQDPEDD